MDKMTQNIEQKTFYWMKQVEQSLRNRYVFIGLIVISAAFHFAMLGFSALAGNPNLIKYGPFHQTIGEVSAMFVLPITPACWAFTIWPVIYLLQYLTMMYSVILLCRHSNGLPAYQNPSVLSPLYFILMSLTSVLIVAWLFLWDRIMLTASLAFLATATLTLFSALVILVTRLTFFFKDLIDSNRRIEVVFLYTVVINGLAMWATWSSIATLLNLGVAAVYSWQLPVSPNYVCYACIGILLILTLVYSILDLRVLHRYTRFILTPYLTVLWALAAMLIRNWNSSLSPALTSVLIVTSVLTLGKFVILVYRNSSMPNSYRRLKVNVATDNFVPELLPEKGNLGEK